LSSPGIRRADKKDIEAIYGLVSQFSGGRGFLRTMSREDIEAEIERFLVADAGGVVGCGRLVSYPGVDEVCSLCVREDWQRRGVGSKLLQALLALSTRRYVAVHTVPVYRGFFSRHGFQDLGPAPRLYHDPSTPGFIREMLGDCGSCGEVLGCPEIIMVRDSRVCLPHGGDSQQPCPSLSSRLQL